MKMIDIAEFRECVKSGKQKPQTAIRLAGPQQDVMVAQDARVVSFIFSDSSVDRYGDTIDARGWVLDNFKANPIALFGHDSGTVENVIGRAVNVRVEGNRLIGDIEFMEASVNPTAEAVFQMVKGGFLKTVSVGFQPIEWHLSKDKNRPGGVDFRKQELLEISIVPIPANPNALQQAKAAGIDIDRLGLARDGAPLVSKRGLYEVSFLAHLLSDLGYLEDIVEWEADYEGDGSDIPQRLTDAMKLLGQILVDMTIEEVSELVAEEDGADPIIIVDDPTALAALSPAQKALRTIAGALHNRGKPITQTMKLDIEMSADSKALLAQFERAGKVLSGANETALRSACDHMTKAMDHVNGVIGTNQPDVDNEDATKSADESERELRARARKHKSRASLQLVVAE